MIVELGPGLRVDVATRAVVIARLSGSADVAEVEAAAQLHADAVHLSVDAAGLSPLASAAAAHGLGVMVDGAGWIPAGSLDEVAAAAPHGVIDAAALAHPDGRPAVVDPALPFDAAALAIEVAAYRRGGRLFLTDDVRRTRRAVDAVAEVVRHRVAS